MIPIHSLLARIRWDPEFGRGSFEIGYYDRVQHSIVKVPLGHVHIQPGNHFSFIAMEPDGSVHDVHSIACARSIVRVYRSGNGLNLLIQVIQIDRDQTDPRGRSAHSFPPSRIAMAAGLALTRSIAVGVLISAAALAVLFYYDAQAQVLHLLEWFEARGVWALLLFTLLMAAVVVLLLPG